MDLIIPQPPQQVSVQDFRFCTFIVSRVKMRLTNITCLLAVNCCIRLTRFPEKNLNKNMYLVYYFEYNQAKIYKNKSC